MKKLNWLLVMTIFFGAALFTGCEEDPLADDITISPNSLPESIETGVATNLQFSIIADAKIASIELRKDNATLELKEDGFTNATSDNYVYSYTATAEEAGTDLGFTLIVTDNKDNTDSYNFTVSVEAGIGGYTAKIMGAHENATYGSFLNAADGTVYKVADAASNQASVDIVYYFGASNQATLASPDDAGAAEFSVYNLASWSTKNATRFTGKLTTDFAATNSSSDIEAAVGTPSATKANQLSQGDVVGFVTAAGKKGLAKVSAVTTGTTGSITIDVKIQL